MWGICFCQSLLISVNSSTINAKYSFRLYEELKAFFHLELTVPQSDTNLVRDLSMWLKLAGSRGRCLLVFDAVNQLDDGSGEEGIQILIQCACY